MKSKYTKMRLFMAVWAIAPVLAYAGLKVVADGDGFSVFRDGACLVSSISVENGEMSPQDIRRSFVTSARHGKVWNAWCDRNDGRYRLEVAERPDGSVELTMAGEVSPYDKLRVRKLAIDIPSDVLDGRGWKAYVGDGRRVKTEAGTWSSEFSGANMRFLATDGLVFDFNPLGAGDWASAYSVGAVKGVWKVERVGKSYRFSGGSFLGRPYGGFTGAKLVIRPGAFEDYPKHHLVRQYNYPMHLKASHSLAFGATRRGERFSEGNIDYSDRHGYGWLSAAARDVVKGAEEGVLYSCVRGRNGVYRISGLPDGHYVLTVEAGNSTGEDNGFSVSVNGDSIVPQVSVARGTARQFAKAVHVTGGIADIALDGNFILSVIALQPILADAEDYSISRGFWCTDGYEPGTIYRNSETNAPAVFRLADETYDLPIPGTETSGAWRHPPSPVLMPDPATPSLAWLKRAKAVKTLCNSSTLAELDDAEDRRRFIGDLTEGKGYSAVMVSGMHSRHTYEAHLARGTEAIGRIADEVHRRGLKLMDHHDATLLWNIDAGFRVLLERVPELQRSRIDGLPSFQLCPNNPVYKETYYRYLRGLVEAGVDGLQLDEVCFFSDRCVCAACRDRFFRETGWRIPANELDRDFNDPDSPLRKRWHVWRVKTIANWFVELRRRLMDVKPDLVVSMYTTHWGFTTSNPKLGTGNDLLELARTVNFFGTEVMPRNPILSGRALLAHRKTMHLLNKAYGTPIWAWFYGTGRQQAYFCWALATMCGQIPLLPDAANDGSGPDFAAFDASPRAMSRDGSEPVARVAVLFSSHSRDWGPNWDSAAEHLGTVQALEAMHVPCEVIGDMSLDEKTLEKYRVLFVGESECLSDAEIGTIRAFAKRGGRVRLGHLAGTRDEIGEPRGVWPFADIFGCEPTAVASVEGRPFGKGTVTYDPTRRGRRFEFRELGPRDINRYQPDERQELAYWQELAAYAQDASVWTTDAPNRVYTSIWRERCGDVVIHFLNAMGGNAPVGVAAPMETPDPAFPEVKRDITFTIEAGREVSVTASSPDFEGERALSFERQSDGRITVAIPRGMLRAYTLIRIHDITQQKGIRQ